MPKRKRRSPKKHEFFNGIEHKYCGSCNPPQWRVLEKFGKLDRAWDGYYYCCKTCVQKNSKRFWDKNLKKRKKARGEALIGFSVCLNTYCTVKKWLQPKDQFIVSHVHTHKVTMHCLTCRDKAKVVNKRRFAACQKIWDDWRKMHPCLKCINDSNYKHNSLWIEADHVPELGKKVKNCSHVVFWSHSKRGPSAQKAELKKCQALCRFHHALQTQQRNHDNGRIQKKRSRLRKGTIINAEKHKRGCCSNSKCKRPVKEGEECGFDFDHRDPLTKFMYNGKPIDISGFVNLPNSVFHTQWPLEQAKCDLLCRNCHKLKTFANRDSYKK